MSAVLSNPASAADGPAAVARALGALAMIRDLAARNMAEEAADGPLFEVFEHIHGVAADSAVVGCALIEDDFDAGQIEGLSAEDLRAVAGIMGEVASVMLRDQFARSVTGCRLIERLRHHRMQLLNEAERLDALRCAARSGAVS